MQAEVNRYPYSQQGPITLLQTKGLGTTQTMEHFHLLFERMRSRQDLALCSDR